MPNLDKMLWTERKSCWMNSDRKVRCGTVLGKNWMN